MPGWRILAVHYRHPACAAAHRCNRPLHSQRPTRLASIIESNEGNNSYGEPGWPAVSTRPWRFYFIPTRLCSSLTRPGPDWRRRQAPDGVPGCQLPIADTKVSYSVSYSLTTPAAARTGVSS